MVFLIAGMNRSGSTWLFNAVRLLLAHSGAPDLAAGWVDNRENVVGHRTAVLKVHAYDADLMGAHWPCAVLVSHRDPRDVMASMSRKFGSEPTVGLARHIFEQYRLWSRHAVYDMKYEEMMADPLAELRRVGAAMGIGEVDYEAVLAELGDLRHAPGQAEGATFDPTTLLHPGHITDGRHGSWREQLPDEVVAEIETEFGAWMASRGYAVGTAGAPHDSDASNPSLHPG